MKWSGNTIESYPSAYHTQIIKFSGWRNKTTCESNIGIKKKRRRNNSKWSRQSKIDQISKL